MNDKIKMKSSDLIALYDYIDKLEQLNNPCSGCDVSETLCVFCNKIFEYEEQINSLKKSALFDCLELKDFIIAYRRYSNIHKKLNELIELESKLCSEFLEIKKNKIEIIYD